MHDGVVYLQLLDEVRAVGPQKMGTSLAGNLVAELVVLLRDIPSGKSDFYVPVITQSVLVSVHVYNILLISSARTLHALYSIMSKAKDLE